MLQLVGLQCVIVVFLDHTLFLAVTFHLYKDTQFLLSFTLCLSLRLSGQQ